MTLTQQIITFLVVVLGTVLTRFTPYIAFPEGRRIPGYVKYLGKVLAPAVFGLLVIYCLRDVHILTPGGTHGIPELISLAVVAVSFVWKRSMVLSMAAGTVLYMVLVQQIMIS